MRGSLCLIISLCLAVACSNNTGTTVPADDVADTAANDTGAHPEVAASEVTDSVAVELPPPLDATQDAVDEDWLGPQCQPGEGCFLDACATNSDCLSGWCLDHMGEKVCSMACSEECPPGWSCEQVSDGGPDLVFVCVSQFANLCRPCVTASDCDGAGGTEDVCVAYGDEGSFCGGTCAATDDCPWGFSCVDSVTVDGIDTKQCVADAGVCPCTSAAVELALFTTCEVANEWGTCTGKRVCTADGLSDCNALVPAQEICNGIDDDCDGDVDEPAFIEGNYVGLCDDQNSCTDDSCAGEAGCEHEALSKGECMDGDPCTVGDHCEEGACVGAPLVCDDSNPCTDDSCDGVGGCLFEPGYGPCDDSDPCTLGDLCTDGECAGTPIACECTADADCQPLEDGDLCNGTLYCDTDQIPYQCRVLPESVVTCPEAPESAGPCQQTACDPASGLCALVPANDGFACDDADACTVGDVCDDGDCTAGVPVACDDHNPCTTDSCDADDGCQHTPAPGPCDDHNDCTVGDACVDGVCSYQSLLDCDDDDVCTTDSCDPKAGCLHKLNTAPCDDGNVCTTGDHCALGECIHAGTLACDDFNACTDDACNPQSGCTFTPNSVPCDDNDACTTSDQCTQGACQGTQPLDCDDANPCTADLCNPVKGCHHQNIPGPCDDSDACTQDDQCSAGTCAGQPISCDDGNVCTDDSCDPATGCLHAPAAGPCDDADACTTNDACADGACAGQPLACDDGNVCTDDSCDSLSGCVYTNNTAPCPDGECVNGECQSPGCNVPATGNLSKGGPAELYGFCWYLTQPGGTCDATCAELGGSNLVPQAENAWPDNCPVAGADDVTTWFYNHGNPGNWKGTGGGTNGHSLGYGYFNSNYYGKCITGTSMNIGAYPGSSNDVDTRMTACPCFAY